MKNKLLFIVLIIMILPALVIAQDGGPVSSVLSVYRITLDADGKEIATITSEVTPGDLIEYRVSYTNNDAGAITALQPMLPIPTGMEFVKDSARPAIISASVSSTGTDFQSLPLTRQVRRPDGTVVTEEVPAREFRRLKWMVESLDVGESVILVARVKVIDK